MVFSSSIFLFVYLPFVLAGYFLLDAKFKNIFLLLVSLIFYAWNEPRYILIMLASIAINYFMGLVIYWSSSKKMWTRRVILFMTVLLNLGLLFYYKYFNFAIEVVNQLFGSNLAGYEIVLPIGISFFTFQGMSYTLDLYMGKVEVQKNPLNIALYISLFPQLIAGPIVRYRDVNEQINSRKISLNGFSYGIQRFCMGLAKKTIIANQLAVTADSIWEQGAGHIMQSTAFLGIVCYTFQIYFDFSGYSDMAIGLGKMFGFDFQENFNYPYISKSITEFWRRWHISLSSWFRDYIYIPLGGSREGNVYIHLFIVFLITGIWHGASWNFIFWGVWNGFFIIVERMIMKNTKSKKNFPVIGRIYTLCIVMIGWTFFRSDTMKIALEYLLVWFGIRKGQQIGYGIGWYFTPKVVLILIIAILASIPWSRILEKRKIVISESIKMIWCILLLIISIMLIMSNTYNPFIYFRF